MAHARRVSGVDRAGCRWHLSIVKLVVAVVAVLTAWLFVEQALLRRRPRWMARLAFLPLGRPKRVSLRDPSSTSVEWPAGWEEQGVEVTPPAGEHAGWMRIRVEGDRSKRFAGVARIDARAVEGAEPGVMLGLRFFPAVLLWAIGMVALLLAIILTLSPTLPGAVISAIVVALAAFPVWNQVQRARARAALALDALVAKLESPRTDTDRKRGGRKKKTR